MRDEKPVFFSPPKYAINIARKHSLKNKLKIDYRNIDLDDLESEKFDVITQCGTCGNLVSKDSPKATMTFPRGNR